MSVFDVHINRAPIAGRVKRIAYVPGKFINADLDKASEDNERQHFLIERAGRAPDRLHPDRRAWSRGGSSRSSGKAMSVDAGQRVGLIRFGSRVDVYLPAGHRAAGAAGPALDRRRDGRSGDRRLDTAVTGISQ